MEAETRRVWRQRLAVCGGRDQPCVEAETSRVSRQRLAVCGGVATAAISWSKIMYLFVR